MLAQRFVERVVPLCITFFLFRLRPLPVPPFYGNLNALNLGAVAKPWHSGTTMLQGSSQALNVYRVSCSQSAPNTVQLAVAARFVAQVLSPLRGSILAGKHRGGLQIRSGFNQVIQDLDTILGLQKREGERLLQNNWCRHHTKQERQPRAKVPQWECPQAELCAKFWRFVVYS